MTVLAQADVPQPTGPDVPAARTTRAPVRGQLPQVDVVRVLTFVAVIAVHVMSSTFDPASTGGEAWLVALHFTREVFFVITGFVLVHSYAGRPLSVPAFYRRRLLLVGLPYLLWSLVYVGVNSAVHPASGAWWRLLGFDLLTGRSSYQLYFLLVSLQAYLLLPALLWLVRRTAGHHRWLLAGSLALQVGELWVIHSHLAESSTGAAQTVELHVDALLPTYQLFLLAGAVAAWNLPRFQAVVERRWRWVAGGALLGLGLVELVYRLQVAGRGAQDAASVFQPVMALWSLAIAGGLYLLGTAYAGDLHGGRTGRVVGVASRLSFGIYLLHPLVLDLWFAYGFHVGPGQLLTPTQATLLLVPVTALVSAAVIAVVQRTRLSTALTGRPAADPSWRWELLGAVLLAVLVTAAAVAVRHT